VLLSISDNWLVATTWNVLEARQEITSTSFYRGAVDTYELTPWAKSFSFSSMFSWGKSSHLQGWSTVSSDNPVGVHKTFILPTTVVNLAFTQTKQSLTPPQLLFTTSAGGVLMMDRRLVSPRRPLADPTAPEVAEGLMLYSPVLPMLHFSLLNHGNTVSRPRVLLSSPSEFESTTTVVLVGVDSFIARVSPAKAFDQLGTDFNALLFLVLLATGAVAVRVLGNMNKKKNLSVSWR
jgi:hypothetical protein